MDIIWHHSRGIEVILAMIVRVEDALQYDVGFAGRELALLAGGESHHVFAPRAFEVRKASLGVFRFRTVRCTGADREGAVGSARGGRGPQGTKHPRDLFPE